MQRSKSKLNNLWAAQSMIKSNECLEHIHYDYFNAGPCFATTDTYTLLPDRLAKFNLDSYFTHLCNQAIDAVKSAHKRINRSTKIAGSIGPLVASYRPDLYIDIHTAASMYHRLAMFLEKHVDVLLIETVSSINQAQGALLAASKTDKPIWISFTVNDFNGKALRSGEKLSDAIKSLTQYNIDAVLINCSRPEAVSEAIKILSGYQYKFGAYANGFSLINKAFLKDNPIQWIV